MAKLNRHERFPANATHPNRTATSPEQAKPDGTSSTNVPTQDAASAVAAPDRVVMADKPSFLGIAILGLKDPNKGYTRDNVHWRTAVSQEEADECFEIHVGDDLRQRFIALNKQGHTAVPQEKLDGIIELRETED
jgi:hypothetical protein